MVDYSMLSLCYQKSISPRYIAPSDFTPRNNFSVFQQVKPMKLPEVLELPVTPSAFQIAETLNTPRSLITHRSQLPKLLLSLFHKPSCRMAANPVPADMQNVMEAIVTLTTQVTAIITKAQNLATAVGNNTTVTTTALSFVMIQGKLKV